MNTLAGAQRDLSNLFGGKTPMAERFAAAQWSTGVTGSPLLDGATVSFDCRISHSASVGTHDILYCEVLAVPPRQQRCAGVLRPQLLLAARRRLNARPLSHPSPPRDRAAGFFLPAE